MLQQNNIKVLVLKQDEWFRALKLLLLGQEFNKYENDNSIQDTDLTNYCPIHSTKSLLSSHSTSGYKIILIVCFENKYFNHLEDINFCPKHSRNRFMEYEFQVAEEGEVRENIEFRSGLWALQF